MLDMVNGTYLKIERTFAIEDGLKVSRNVCNFI